MTDTTEVERHPLFGTDVVRATEYDALAAKLAAAERRERQLLDTTATCRMLRRELNTAKAKLAKAEAEVWEQRDLRNHQCKLKLEAMARAEAAEAKLAEADAMIEAQQKDYASNNVRFAEAEHRAKAAEQRVATLEAALPAVYRLGLDDAAEMLEPKNPVYDWTDFARQHHADAIEIRTLPTPKAAELMARIQIGEKE